MGRASMIYFIAYFIANFAAFAFSAAMVEDIRYESMKLFFFAILITVFQFVLQHFLQLDLILTIFSYPLIYMVAIYILAKITKLIRADTLGASLKAALMVVFFQLCTKGLFAWKLEKVFNI